MNNFVSISTDNALTKLTQSNKAPIKVWKVQKCWRFSTDR